MQQVVHQVRRPLPPPRVEAQQRRIGGVGLVPAQIGHARTMPCEVEEHLRTGSGPLGQVRTEGRHDVRTRCLGVPQQPHFVFREAEALRAQQRGHALGVAHAAPQIRHAPGRPILRSIGESACRAVLIDPHDQGQPLWSTLRDDRRRRSKRRDQRTSHAGRPGPRFGTVRPRSAAPNETHRPTSSSKAPKPQAPLPRVRSARSPSRKPSPAPKPAPRLAPAAASGRRKGSTGRAVSESRTR